MTQSAGPAPTPATEAAAGIRTQPRVEHSEGPAVGHSTTIRLPLVTATFTRRDPAAGQADAGPAVATYGAAAAPVAARSGPRGLLGRPSGRRLAFYAGASALAVLGVVEWPVTLLVVAGTYAADRARSATPTPTPASATVVTTGPV